MQGIAHTYYYVPAKKVIHWYLASKQQTQIVQKIVEIKTLLHVLHFNTSRALAKKSACI